ncbi:hypothetical protein MNB_SV-14-1009 [hydrothermal vent metagenome]|uniref:Uncharacterized protein n=1 Tax=hydrothermal vent metagenome TaxID=652676 RepID=A0A1W1CEC4_9ZZZZ
MFNNKDEYTQATENASINQHRKGNKRGYKLGIFNLLLLTTIGVMAYVNLDTLKEKSNLFNGIVLNTDKSDSKLLKKLSSVDINSVDKKDSESINLAINDVVSKSIPNNNSSFYTQALLHELNKNSVQNFLDKN